LKYNADSGALINILVKALLFARTQRERQALREDHYCEQDYAASQQTLHDRGSVEVSNELQTLMLT
jgi:hypothetical protein